MAKAMEGIELRIQTHFRQPEVKPCVEFAIQDGTQFALVVAGLKERRVGAYVVRANDSLQRVDGADRAQLRALVVAGQGYLLNPLTVLDCLGLVKLE